METLALATSRAVLATLETTKGLSSVSVRQGALLPCALLSEIRTEDVEIRFPLWMSVLHLPTPCPSLSTIWPRSRRACGRPRPGGSLSPSLRETIAPRRVPFPLISSRRSSVSSLCRAILADPGGVGDLLALRVLLVLAQPILGTSGLPTCADPFAWPSALEEVAALICLLRPLVPVSRSLVATTRRAHTERGHRTALVPAVCPSRSPPFRAPWPDPADDLGLGLGDVQRDRAVLRHGSGDRALRSPPDTLSLPPSTEERRSGPSSRADLALVLRPAEAFAVLAVRRAGPCLGSVASGASGTVCATDPRVRRVCRGGAPIPTPLAP